MKSLSVTNLMALAAGLFRDAFSDIGGRANQSPWKKSSKYRSQHHNPDRRMRSKHGRYGNGGY